MKKKIVKLEHLTGKEIDMNTIDGISIYLWQKYG
jgi:hypothetical protein